MWGYHLSIISWLFGGTPLVALVATGPDITRLGDDDPSPNGQQISDEQKLSVVTERRYGKSTVVLAIWSCNWWMFTDFPWICHIKHRIAGGCCHFFWAQHQGEEVWMCTGDHSTTAAAVADELGILMKNAALLRIGWCALDMAIYMEIDWWLLVTVWGQVWIYMCLRSPWDDICRKVGALQVGLTCICIVI